MKRLSTYFIIGCIICGYCNAAVAGTSVISNVLIQSNSYLKEAGLVQKKYSGIARSYAQMKVGIPDDLGGGKVAAARAQAEATQEKIERAQEQVAMAQEAQANAMAKVADLNAKMTSAMETAQSTLSEGIAITEQYKNTITESIDTVKNAPDIAQGLADRAINSVKDTAVGTVDGLKDTANSVKDQAGGIAGDIRSASGQSSDTAEYEAAPIIEEASVADFKNGTVVQVQETGTFRQPVSVSQSYELQAVQPQAAMVVQQDIQVAEPNRPQALLSNRAAAIQSAAVMADKAVIEDVKPQLMSSLPEMPVAETAVTAADVMAAAASQPIREIKGEIQRSSLNIEEQLQQSSNRTDANKMLNLGQPKAVLEVDGKTEAIIEKPAARRLFDKDTEAVRAKAQNIQPAVLKTEQKVKTFDSAIKNPNVVRKKEIIGENVHE